MNWPDFAFTLIPPLVGGAGFWAYVTARRNTSGNVAQTSAERLWEASNEHRTALAFRVEALEKGRAETEQRLKDCERDRSGLEARLTQIEAETIAAQIVERARLEATKIRAEAADAKEVITTAAAAAAEVVSDTATATASELTQPPHNGGRE